ncbi:RNase adapter RapZ [Arcanobacterium phocisimile]|uniref:RNase adapter RapZ n=1 Tax=Arcanobacterium phocisimile TaxID=1302235 RepID=A0ABX7IEJ0_9ACTO|nr:RNase adapter RapZ [Arcanobacterium phocisimile]QRV01381.1 RNase adapter RapZ [Arcanobacterium phocisimile]
MDNINDTANIPLGIVIDDATAQLPSPEIPEILIITGMSGAGRSKAAATLEDLGWYVVDNLPPRLLSALAGLVTPTSGVRRLAAVVDVRSQEFFEELEDVMGSLQEHSVDYRILFLDASNQALVQRYESVRRPHPLQGDGRLLDGLIHERTILEPLRRRADTVIDTTDLSVHDLSRKVRQLVASVSDTDPHLTVMSFGFKYGLPMDADHVADVRFLPNPYWVTELRKLTGKDAPVRDFVLGIDGAQDFGDKYVDLIHPILEGYTRELKPYVTIAIGCTGGKHRSVAMTEYVSGKLRELGHSVRTIHRDLGRE